MFWYMLNYILVRNRLDGYWHYHVQPLILKDVLYKVKREPLQQQKYINTLYHEYETSVGTFAIIQPKSILP